MLRKKPKHNSKMKKVTTYNEFPLQRSGTVHAIMILAVPNCITDTTWLPS